jgi:hypothetical protein
MGMYEAVLPLLYAHHQGQSRWPPAVHSAAVNAALPMLAWCRGGCNVYGCTVDFLRLDMRFSELCTLCEAAGMMSLVYVTWLSQRAPVFW